MYKNENQKIHENYNEQTPLFHNASTLQNKTKKSESNKYLNETLNTLSKVKKDKNDIIGDFSLNKQNTSINYPQKQNDVESNQDENITRQYLMRKKEKQRLWEQRLQISREERKRKRKQRKQKRQALRKWSSYPAHKIKQLLLIVAAAFVFSYIFVHFFPSTKATVNNRKFNISDRIGEGKSKYDIHFIMEFNQSQKMMNYSLTDLGIDKWVQVGTQLDYFNVQFKKTHRQFKDKIRDYFKHEIYLLQHNKKIIKGIQTRIQDNFGENTNDEKLQNYQKRKQERDKKEQKNLQMDLIQKDIQRNNQIQKYLTAKYLQKLSKIKKDDQKDIYEFQKAVQQMDKRQIQKIQQEYFDKMYYINKLDVQKQPKICIFCQIYENVNHIQLSRLFQSIQKQTYSNYKIIIIDDNPLLKLTQKIIYHLRNKRQTFNEKDFTNKQGGVKYQQIDYFKYDKEFIKKIKIIRNQQKIGILPSYYLHIPKCSTSQIVAYINIGDFLISNQVLKIIANTYEDKNLWVVYSKSLVQDNKSNKGENKKIINLQNQFNKQNKYQFIYTQGQSKNFSIPTTEYRESNTQLISNLLTHRSTLINKLPIQQFVQYEYVDYKKKLHPRFLKIKNGIQFNKSLIYTLVQLSSNSRLAFLNEFLYYQALSSQLKIFDQDKKMIKAQICQNELIQFDEYKIKVKKQLKSLENEYSYFQFENSRQIKKTTLEKYAQLTDKYRKCIQKYS